MKKYILIGLITTFIVTTAILIYANYGFIKNLFVREKTAEVSKIEEKEVKNIELKKKYIFESIPKEKTMPSFVTNMDIVTQNDFRITEVIYNEYNRLYKLRIDNNLEEFKNEEGEFDTSITSLKGFTYTPITYYGTINEYDKNYDGKEEKIYNVTFYTLIQDDIENKIENWTFEVVNDNKLKSVNIKSMSNSDLILINDKVEVALLRIDYSSEKSILFISSQNGEYFCNAFTETQCTGYEYNWNTKNVNKLFTLTNLSYDSEFKVVDDEIDFLTSFGEGGYGIEESYSYNLLSKKLNKISTLEMFVDGSPDVLVKKCSTLGEAMYGAETYKLTSSKNQSLEYGYCYNDNNLYLVYKIGNGKYIEYTISKTQRNNMKKFFEEKKGYVYIKNNLLTNPENNIFSLIILGKELRIDISKK